MVLGFGQPVAERAVPDLVMVLRTGDQARRTGLQRSRDACERAVLGVVAVAFPREQCVQRMVERVVPLRVVTPLLDRPPVADRDLADHHRVANAFLQLGER